MTGTTKLPLLVIGKSKTPRCFKGVKSLPCTYRNNKTAWMTTELFHEWLRKIDGRFRREKKKIALIIDNAPCHPAPKQALSNITIFFLPPNTTSCTQPMDQGIIKNLKHRYRRRVIEELLKEMEKGQKTRVNVLTAMHFARRAWDAVTPACIAHCYRHCGFTTPEPPEEEWDEEDDIPLARLLTTAQEKGVLDPMAGTVEDFITCDDETATCARLEDAAIVAAVQNTPDTAEDEEEDDGAVDEPPMKPPTDVEAQEMCDKLRLYIQAKAGGEDLFTGINKVADFAKKSSQKELIQPKLFSFFK